MRATYSASTRGMHPMSSRHGLISFFGEPAAHGISRDAVMVGEADHGVGQKIEGPTRAALGRA
jgi:hypothetical protein